MASKGEGLKKGEGGEGHACPQGHFAKRRLCTNGASDWHGMVISIHTCQSK